MTHNDALGSLDKSIETTAGVILYKFVNKSQRLSSLFFFFFF